MIQQTNTIPKEWRKVQFVDCIDLSSLKKLKGLKKSEYKNDGKYLILDQGQDFISGYTDNIEFVNKKYPAILFGDHTRIVKFIDFPFAVGADGTKIFQSKKENNPKFLYYSLLNLDIPNTGYNRHFKLVKESKILLPPLTEQTKIAEILSSVDEEIKKIDQEIKKTEELKKGLMTELLTKGIGHKKLKKTKLGMIPEEWEVVRLDEVAKVERGKFSNRPRNDPKFYGGEYPFIQTGDVVNSNGRIQKYNQTLNKKGLAVSRMFKSGTVVITIAANIGDTGILEFDSCFPDSLVGIIVKENMNNIFLEYYLRTRKDYLNSIATQSAQKNINLEKLRPLLIIKPKIEEQKQIAEILSAIDDKINIYKQVKNKLAELKRGLTQDLLEGRARVI